MKYQKLVNELNELLDTSMSEQQKHQEKLNYFFSQFKEKEYSLRKKLKKENNKISRKKLKRKLGKIEKAYALLDVA